MFLSPKEWFIKIDDKEEGPFTKKELKYIPRLSPYTLVRKKHWTTWLYFYEVEELHDLYEEEESRGNDPIGMISPKGEAVLNRSFDPGHFFLYIILSLLIIMYAIYVLLY